MRLTGTLESDDHGRAFIAISDNPNRGPVFDSLLAQVGIGTGSAIVLDYDHDGLIIRSPEAAEARQQRESVHQLMDLAYDKPDSLPGKVLRLTYVSGVIDEVIIEHFTDTKNILVVYRTHSPSVPYYIHVDELYHKNPLVEIIDPTDLPST